MKLIPYFFCIAGVILYVCIFRLVYIETAGSNIPFDTDEADHANSALELYSAIKSGSISGTYEAIIRQAFYPPAYSAVVAGSYFLSGPSFVSSRLPALACFILYCLMMVLSVKYFLSNRPLKRLHGAATITAVLTGVFAVTSPITIYNSALCMLELPGILAVSLCIFCFVRGNPLMAVPMSLLVFFTKYNFGIITIPAVIMTIWYTHSFKKAFYCGFLQVLLISCWSLLSYKDSFIHFFLGHKSYAPMLSSENLLFELNSWLNYYSINFTAAALLLLLALLGAIKNIRQPAVVFCSLNTFFAFFILALSTTNEERHFMVALPGILFLSGIGINYIIEKARNSVSVVTAGVIMASFIINFYQKTPEVTAHLKAQYEGEAGFAELFKYIYENTGTASPVLFYGISDSFSIETLRWYFAKNSGMKYTEVNLDAYPYRDDKNFTAKMRKRNLDKPYQRESFPKKPLESILAKSYYGYAVHIHNKDKRQRFFEEGEEFKSFLATKMIGKTSSGSHEIEIYKIL